MGRGAIGAVSPLLGLGAVALKTGMNFDKAMSKVQAVSGATGGELEQLRKRALEIGNTTPKSASDAANAMTYLAQAGFKTNEVMKLSKPLVKLSIAGNMDMARTTDLWVGAMKSANIPLSQNQKFLDQISKTANTTNSDIGTLMESWQTAGASIQSSNMTMAQANGLFGILANASIKGSEAGTVVSRVFQRMNEASGESANAMKKLGINVADSQGKLRNKIEVLRELREKTMKLTEAERAQYLQAIGGKQYSEQLQQMLKGLDGSFDSLTGKIDKSKGAMGKMTKVMADNLSGDVDDLKAKFEAAMIHISDAIKPIARDMVKNISGFLGYISKIDPHTIRLIANITKWIVVFGATNIVLGKVKQTIGGFAINLARTGKYLVGTKEGGHNLKNTIMGISKAFKMLGGGIGKSIGLFGKIKNLSFVGKLATKISLAGNLLKTTVFGGFTKIIGLGKGLMGMLAGLGPIGWVAIAALVVGVPLVIKNWDKVKETFGKVKASISNFAHHAGERMKKFYDKFKDTAVGRAMKPFVDAVKGVFNSIKTIFSGAVDFVSGVFTGNWSKALNGAKTIFKGFGSFIINNWKMIMGILSFPIRAVVNIAKDLFIAGANKVKDVWNRLKNRLKSALKAKVTCIADAFHRGIEGVKKAWNNIKEFLSHPIKGVVNLFQNNEADGSHSGGLGRVPFDGYRAILHRDEMVLTKGQADAYRNKRNEGKSVGGKKIIIGKIADTLNVNNKADAEHLAKKLAEEILLAV